MNYEECIRYKTVLGEYSENDKVYSHLQSLENEAIHIIREVAASYKSPVMLYSVGKDSSVMMHLAKKAFYPASPPFPFLHVDTSWKFKEMIDFRNHQFANSNLELLVYTNLAGLKDNINPITSGVNAYTYIMKTVALREALDKFSFDAAFGGARRDEEASRSKERIISVRSAGHTWDPKNQRPELWSLYNTRLNKGQSVRVFPLSNWTELDVWRYIEKEKIPIVPLYLSKDRPIISRSGQLIMVDDERLTIAHNEQINICSVRFRTLGCYPLTGAIRSVASTIPEIINEMKLLRTSERTGRLIDTDDAESMEKKKREGYF